MSQTVSPPNTVLNVIKDVRRNRRLSAGIQAMQRRAKAFDNPLEMQLAGVVAVPEARELLETRLDESWAMAASYGYPRSDHREIILGGGYHAAVYAASRVALGFAPPLVLEADQPGGTFGMSRRPSFYLNSSNRPGRLGGPPMMGQALNYLPGAPIQPAAMSGGRYQTNADMSLAIRLCLAMNACVIPSSRVVEIEIAGGGPYMVRTDRGLAYVANRIIDARGVGKPKDEDRCDGKRLMTFPQLMARMDTQFPLEGIRRLAVVGGGNAGMCAIEAVTGLGPAAHMSAAAMDWVEQIDLYAPNLYPYCDDWRSYVRGRYNGIAGLLPRRGRENEGRTRLRVIQNNGSAMRSLSGAVVNDRNYDAAILATGYRLEGSNVGIPGFNPRTWELMGAEGYGGAYARKMSREEIYAIGPAADLPYSSQESQDDIDSNPTTRVAMFRLAGRTSTLATKLAS